MLGTTTETDKKIKSVLKYIEELKSELNDFFIKGVYSKRSIDYYLSKYEKIKSKTITLYEDTLFDTDGLEKIEKDIFFRVENVPHIDVSILSTYVNILNTTVQKKLSKKEKTKAVVQGLKTPFRWEDITFIFTGRSVIIKQNQMSLGEYDLDDLGIPKATLKKGGSVFLFFSLLFAGTTVAEKDKTHLRSNINSNHKHKGKLKDILCNAFDTTKDPFFIDERTNTYKPFFKVKQGRELNINNHRSGSDYFDDTYEEAD